MSDSFFDRAKAFNRAMPPSLSSSAKHVLNAIFFHSDMEGVSWVGADTIAAVATMTRSACFRALKELTDAGLIVEAGWEVHGPNSRTRRRRIVMENADRSARSKRAGQRVGSVEKPQKNAPGQSGSPVSETVGSPIDGIVGSPVSGIPEVRSVGFRKSGQWDSHIKMNLPGEPKRRTTQEEPSRKNRILSDKNRTMDVVGNAIGENSKLGQGSLLSQAEDQALASLRHPAKAGTKKAPHRSRSDVEGFDEWYDLYAHKVAPAKAAQAYAKAVKGGVPPVVLLACLRRQLPAMQRKIAAGERQFVKHPASWLNSGAWANGLSSAQQQALCAPGADVEGLLDEALGLLRSETERTDSLSGRRDGLARAQAEIGMLVAGDPTARVVIPTLTARPKKAIQNSLSGRERQPAPSHDDFWDEQRDGQLPDRTSHSSREQHPSEPQMPEEVAGWRLAGVVDKAYLTLGVGDKRYPRLPQAVAGWLRDGMQPPAIYGKLRAIRERGLDGFGSERSLDRFVRTDMRTREESVHA